MTDAPPAPEHSSGPPHSGTTCGNCGAAVAATDVICPACDVLLAAYQAPTGASPVDAATQSISMLGPPSPQPPAPAPDRPASTNPAMMATSGSGASSSSPEPSSLFASSSAALHQPPHQPRTMSLIDDALDRIEERGSSIGSDVEIPSSDDVAAELSKMAENDSELAKDVDARLRGAKVRFDGASPTIETQPGPEPASSTPAPQVPAAGSNRATQRDHGAAAYRTLAPIPALPGAARPARQGTGRRQRHRDRPLQPGMRQRRIRFAWSRPIRLLVKLLIRCEDRPQRRPLLQPVVGVIHTPARSSAPSRSC